jgi:hypothetical protein
VSVVILYTPGVNCADLAVVPLMETITQVPLNILQLMS